MNENRDQKITEAVQKLEDIADWLPERTKNYKGEQRCVGVEIEFAGVAADDIVKCIQAAVGGEARAESSVLKYVDKTEWGRFKVELDASYIKYINEKDQNSVLAEKIVDVLTWAAEQIVPWEVVTPPVPVSQMWKMPALVNDLRKLGALGTRHALHFAFGVHYNPDLPSLDVETILKYLRAFFCLYDWIVHQDNTDNTRKISRYIAHFDLEYIRLVIDSSYMPTIERFIQDYLEHNPTRNRSLDLLPLLSYINESLVKSIMNDPRIKARPTFHYRLSNCDIDNERWNIGQSWHYWLQVEKLASDDAMLDLFLREYSREIVRKSGHLDDDWVDRCHALLESSSSS